VQQHPRPLDVAQELVPQPDAAMRTLDQARDVCQHESEVIALSHAKVWLQRGEWVVADFRGGRRQRRQQAGLPDVRVPDQADVSDCLELQHQPARLARLTLLGHRWRLVRGRHEVNVAQPATTAPRHHHLVVCPAQVGQQLAVRRDHGPERHQDADVLAGLAVLLRAGAVAAPPGLEMAAVAELEQRAHARGRLEVDTATATAVAAVRPASGHKLLSPEAAGTVAAVTRLRKDRGGVDRILDVGLLLIGHCEGSPFPGLALPARE
jgi:hypothetical protein